MESGKLYTITDIIKSVPECAELTNQRVSALVRQLIAEGKVERVEEKRKAYFKKIG
jgi:predicted transcriptional regulator